MKTVRIFPNVSIGEGVVFQDWVVVGIPPRGIPPGALETVIEAGAVIRSHTVIYAGSRIGAGFQTGHRTILGPGLEIGVNCSVGTDTVVMGYARLFPQVKVHGYCSIGAFCVIQEKAWVGPHCLVESEEQKPTIIAAGAILGSEVYVSPGIRVGERSLVAAGVNLTQDVPPYRLIAGNPSKAFRNIAQLTCPYELIDSPYKPELPSIQEVVKVRHQTRFEDEAPTNTWRHHLWQRLGKPQMFF